MQPRRVAPLCPLPTAPRGSSSPPRGTVWAAHAMQEPPASLPGVCPEQVPLTKALSPFLGYRIIICRHHNSYVYIEETKSKSLALPLPPPCWGHPAARAVLGADHHAGEQAGAGHGQEGGLDNPGTGASPATRALSPEEPSLAAHGRLLSRLRPWGAKRSFSVLRHQTPAGCPHPEQALSSVNLGGGRRRLGR